MPDDLDGFEASPYSTVPEDVVLTLLDFTSGHPETQCFSAAMSQAIMDCGRVMDLERLDGVTVAFDFDAALSSIDLGYESAHAKGYTKTEEFLCVGKALTVRRCGKLMSHVVFHAPTAGLLIHPEHESHPLAVNIIAHEFAHVTGLKWNDEAMPGLLLAPYQTDWFTASLFDAALIVWDEYLACRLAAGFGDAVRQRKLYAKNYEGDASLAVSRTREPIRSYRLHGDLEKMMAQIRVPLIQPLKLAGYLLGHLDGMEDKQPLDALCLGHIGTPYQSLLPALRAELRNLWDTRDHAAGVERHAGLIKLIIQIYEGIGVYPKKQGNGYYVSIPYSPETLPRLS
ncbi:MAG: hypothetical protein EPN36_16955 [Rhodanobacteraceae bacterium]|nr:MAG: hypothetical protein EPN36_16955 [Rhodanobacteraceae bacterium]